MNSEFYLYGFNLPCGLIHDQKLSNVKVENNTIVFTFDTHFLVPLYLPFIAMIKI